MDSQAYPPGGGGGFFDFGDDDGQFEELEPFDGEEDEGLGGLDDDDAPVEGLPAFFQGNSAGGVAFGALEDDALGGLEEDDDVGYGGVQYPPHLFAPSASTNTSSGNYTTTNWQGLTTEKDPEGEDLLASMQDTLAEPFYDFLDDDDAEDDFPEIPSGQGGGQVWNNQFQNRNSDRPPGLEGLGMYSASRASSQYGLPTAHSIGDAPRPAVPVQQAVAPAPKAEPNVKGVFSLEELESRMRAPKPAPTPVAAPAPPVQETQIENLTAMLKSAIRIDKDGGQSGLNMRENEAGKIKKKQDKPFPKRGTKFVYHGPGTKMMTPDNIDLVLRTQRFQSVAAGGNPYTEDFYYQNYARLQASKRGTHPPEDVLPKHAPMYPHYPAVVRAKKEGEDPLEGALGKIPYTTSRAPRVLIQLDENGEKNPLPYGCIRRGEDVPSPSPSFSTHKAHVLIEELYVHLLLLEDATACAMSSGPTEDLERERRLHSGSVADLLRVPELIVSSQRGEPGEADGQLLACVGIKKGQHLLSRLLQSLPLSVSYPIIIVILQNLPQLLQAVQATGGAGLLGSIKQCIGSQFKIAHVNVAFRALMVFGQSGTMQSPLGLLIQTDPGKPSLPDLLVYKGGLLRQEYQNVDAVQWKTFDELYKFYHSFLQNVGMVPR